MDGRSVTAALQRPSSWLLVGGVLGFYGWAAAELLWRDPDAGAPLVWWVALVAPPLAYGGLIVLCLRCLTRARWTVVLGLLGAVHAVLSLLTGAFDAAVGPLPFAVALGEAWWGPVGVPFLQLLTAPLLLFPFRHLLVPAVPSPPVRPAAPGPRTRTPVHARAAWPTPTPVQRADTPTRSRTGTPRALRVAPAWPREPALGPRGAGEPVRTPTVVAARGEAGGSARGPADPVLPREGIRPAGAPVAVTSEPPAASESRPSGPAAGVPPGARPLAPAAAEAARGRPPDGQTREAREGPPSPIPSRAAELPAPARSALRPDHRAEAQSLVAVFGRVGALSVDVEQHMGLTLFTVASPRLERDAVASGAFRFLPLLGDPPEGQAVGQATLRGSNGAMVLTPLGPVSAGGPVLVVAVRERGSLALLELRARDVAARYRARHPELALGSELSTPECLGGPELRETVVPATVAGLADCLDAWGALSARAFVSPGAPLGLYLFLPRGVDGPRLGRLAWDLYRATEMGGESSALGTLGSIVLRRRWERVVIRPVASRARGPALLVAVGSGLERPGLAHRQLERAVSRLGAA